MTESYVAPWPRRLYILEGRTAVQIEDGDLSTFEKWKSEHPDSENLAVDTVDGAEIKTTFLGWDHGLYHVLYARAYGRPEPPPLLFETRIHGGPHHMKCRRYSTYDEALAGHVDMLDAMKRNFQ